MRISDWSSDVCSSDLNQQRRAKAVLMHIIETLAPAQVACARILPTQLPRHAEGDPVIHNRDVDGTFQLAPVEPAIESADIAAEIIGRQFRRDEHGSSQRIAAKIG